MGKNKTQNYSTSKQAQSCNAAPVSKIQFHSNETSQENSHLLNFLTLLSSHPEVVSISFQDDGRTSILLFITAEACSAWYQNFSLIKFNHSRIVTSPVSSSSTKLTVCAFNLKVSSFPASSRFTTNPAFSLTPVTPRAEALAKLITPQYILSNGFLKFDEIEHAQSYRDLLTSTNLDFRYKLVDGNAVNGNPVRKRPTLEKNAGFLIKPNGKMEESMAYKEAKAIEADCDLIEMPRNYCQVQFSTKELAEKYFAYLKGPMNQTIGTEYKLQGIMQTKMPSSDHRLLTCAIWFQGPPTYANVKQLLPKSVTRFDISKKPKSNNKNMWYIHCEFADSATAQASLMPTLQNLKILNPFNMVFPTNNYLTLYDKEHEITSNYTPPKLIPPVTAASSKLSDVFTATFRASDRGQFGFVNVHTCEGWINDNLGTKFAELGDAVLPTTVQIQTALHGDRIEFRISTEFLFNEQRRMAVPFPKNKSKDLTGLRLIAEFVSLKERARECLVGVLRPQTALPEADTAPLIFTSGFSAMPYFLVSRDKLEGIDINPSKFYKIWLDSEKHGYASQVQELPSDFGHYTELAMEQLMTFYNIEHEVWSDAILAEVPSEQEAPGPDRRDFRSECVFTIDPRMARDMDDGIHIKRLGDRLELGVHIADVSYYVDERRAPNLLAHAKRSSTSFYFPDRVIHMLPEQLSANLCSLRPYVDRFTLSMTWEINESDMTLIPNTFWYGRGVIKSRAKLAYDDVQVLYNEYDKKDSKTPSAETMQKLWSQFDAENAILDDYVPVLSKFKTAADMEDAMDSAILLLRFTRALENRRDRLIIHSKMSQYVHFSFGDDSKAPTDIQKTTHIESQRVIENLMLLANEYAAKTLLRSYPDSAMIRKHAGLKVKDVLKTLQELEATCVDRELLNIIEALKNTVTSPHSGDLNSVLSRMQSHEVKVFFSNILSMNMNQAEYTCPAANEGEVPELGHYALNLEQYTHFTSPIRRYPDIIVHRQLLKSKADDVTDVNSLKDICQIANDRKKASRESQGAAEKIQLAAYLHGRYGVKGMKAKGFVQSVEENRLTVSVTTLGGGTFPMIYHLMNDVTDFRYNAGAKSVEIRRNKPRVQKIVLKLFDVVDIRVAAPSLDVMLEDPVIIMLD